MVNGERTDAIAGAGRGRQDAVLAEYQRRDPGGGCNGDARAPARSGYEWDEDLDNGFRPAGSDRPLHDDHGRTGVQVLQDYGSTYGTGTATHT